MRMRTMKILADLIFALEILALAYT